MTLTKSKYYFEALDNYPYSLPDCLEALNYALSYDPEDADSLCLMGRIYSEMLNDYEKAKLYFEEAMHCDVTNLNTPKYYIKCLLDNEDFQEAEKLSLRDREKAAEGYRKAIKLKPNYPAAYIGLARVLSESGDTDGALKAIRDMRRIAPANAEASAIEGRVFKDMGEEAKAVAAFRRSITQARGFQPEAFTGLGLLYKEKAEAAGAAGSLDDEAANYAEAAKDLSTGLKQLAGAPDASVLYQLLGLIYERQKKYDDAIRIYNEFLQRFPDSNEAPTVRSFIEQIKKQMP